MWWLEALCSLFVGLDQEAFCIKKRKEKGRTFGVARSTSFTPRKSPRAQWPFNLSSCPSPMLKLTLTHWLSSTFKSFTARYKFVPLVLSLNKASKYLCWRGGHCSPDLGSSLKWLDFTFYILRSTWRRVKERLMSLWNWFSVKVTVKINELSNKKNPPRLATALICCLLPHLCSEPPELTGQTLFCANSL